MTNIEVPATGKLRKFNPAHVGGYDFFISFKLGPAPIGAQSYASDLARKLRELDFTVFFSEDDAPPGVKLDITLIKALHRTKILVVIANEGALLHSQWVREEVEEFRQKYPKRTIIPINIDHAIERFDLQVEASKWLSDSNIIRQDETGQAILEGISSIEVIKRLQASVDFTRTNTWFRRTVWGIAVILLVLMALAGFKAWEANQNFEDANRKFRDATSLRLLAESEPINSGFRPGGTIKGLLMLLAAQRLSRLFLTDEALQTEYLKLKQLILVRENSADITSVALSPDGNRFITASRDGYLWFWDAKTGKIINQLRSGHNGGVTSVAFSRNGNRAVSIGNDGTMQLWDMTMNWSVNLPYQANVIGGFNSTSFSPDSLLIASSGGDKTVRLWDAKTGQSLGNPFRGHKDFVSCVAFSPDGTLIASGSNDKTLRFWDAKNGTPIGQPLTGHTDAVISIAFSTDGSLIVSGSSDKTLRLWDVKKRAPIDHVFKGHEDKVYSVAFTSDSTRILSGSSDGTIKVWDMKTGMILDFSLKVHESPVTHIAFSQDGNRALSIDNHNALQLWDTNFIDNRSQPSNAHKRLVYSGVAFSPNGQRIISSGIDNTLRLWDAKTGQSLGEPFTGHGGEVNGVAFSPDGKHIVSGSSDKTLRLWDVNNRQLIVPPLIGHKRHILNVAFSPNGRFIASGDLDEFLLWDAQTGNLLEPPFETGGSISVAFSPDSKSIASTSDFCLSWWNVNTRQFLGDYCKGHKEYILSVAFSPDGNSIVSGSGDKTVRLWDVKTRKTIGQPLTGHKGMVTSVAFSPDGKYVVSGSEDETLRLWDAKIGRSMGEPLKGHNDIISSVAFSPDGKYIVSGSANNTPHVWPVFDGWADEICKKLARNMSHKEWREWVTPDIDYIEQCPGLPIPPDEPETTAATEKTQP